MYERICTSCHAENGKGGHAGGAVLSERAVRDDVATTGRKAMPSFLQVLTGKERRDVAVYLTRMLTK